MILTKKLLTQWNACQKGINFCERNNLFGFDLSRIDEIEGDYNDFINWLKSQLCIQREYDSNGNKIKQKSSNGCWVKYEYDQYGNKIKEIDRYGYWTIWKYDSNGNIIKQESSNGYWIKYHYDSNGNIIKQESSESEG